MSGALTSTLLTYNYAPAGAFESIATVNGTGLADTITFSNIPSGYQHLQVRFIGKLVDTAIDGDKPMLIRINGDTAANYARHRLSGDGATVTASGTASSTSMSSVINLVPSSATAVANMMCVGIIDIHDYLSTSKNKTVRMFFGLDNNRTTTPTGQIALNSGLYFATPAAVTSLSFIVSGGEWTTTTKFALYGIKGA